MFILLREVWQQQKSVPPSYKRHKSKHKFEVYRIYFFKSLYLTKLHCLLPPVHRQLLFSCTEPSFPQPQPYFQRLSRSFLKRRDSKAPSRACRKGNRRRLRPLRGCRQAAALLGKQPSLIPCSATSEYPRAPPTKKQQWKEFFPLKRTYFSSFQIYAEQKANAFEESSPGQHKWVSRPKENTHSYPQQPIHIDCKALFCDLNFSVPAIQYNGVVEEEHRHPVSLSNNFCYRSWGCLH